MVSETFDPLIDDTREVVSVQKLSKTYGKTKALSDVSVRIQHGEIFGLIGPDGSGKSSLIRAVAGVQRYDSGTVKVFRRRVQCERSAEAVKSRMGLMPQGLGNNLYSELSIEENIDYFAGLREVSGDVLLDRKERLMEMTRLTAFRHRPMKQLSGGMKQKLGLICTLIHEPELVLLDEPTTGVDPVSRRDFWAILTQLVHQSGMSAIVSTAYMDEAAYMDRLALLMNGEVISEGKEEEIEALIPGTVVAYQSECSFADAQRIQTKFPLVQSLGNNVRVFIPHRHDDDAKAAVSACVDAPPDKMSVSPPELEDVLASLLCGNDESHHKSSSDRLRQAPENQSIDQAPKNSPIVADNLVRDFGDFRAVDDVSFEIPEGRIFGLLGANGAGKTTVIKMLTGLLRVSSGTGSVAGADITRASQAIRERIGYMSQSFSLYTDMTALENLEFYAGVYGLFPRERRIRVPELIVNTGLDGYENRLTSTLPMGIRQRLALACALVHRPTVIFLDEPTSGVDVLGRRLFWDILQRLARQDNVAILVTTHYMSEAEHCDDLALMYAGRVIASGTPDSLKTRLAHEVGSPLLLSTSDPLSALRVAESNGYQSAALFGRFLRVLSRDAFADEQHLRNLFFEQNIRVGHTRRAPIAMEDVFVNSILSAEQELKTASR